MFFKQNYPYRLLTPGPVPLHPKVMSVLAEPSIHHRTPEFEQCLKRVAEKLKDTFSTQQPVLMQASTGTGAMESAIVNTLSPGDEVLCVVSGKFGERWAQIAKAFGLKVEIINVPWGEAVKVSSIQTALEQNQNLKAVLVQACETSTATINPIQEIAELTKNRAQTLLMVDAITAVGAMELEMDKWGLDVVIGGSQKAFMLPAGLSFIALSQKAWRFCETSKLPKFYWDLLAEKKSLAKGETHFSSVVPLIRALDVSLQFLTGNEKLITLKRIQNLARATREAAPALNLTVFSQAPSPSVTALLTPPGLGSQKLRDHVESKYNLTLMGGQDQLKDKIIRIGHLGHITDDDMYALFDILYLSINTLLPGTLNKSNLNQAHKILEKYLDA